jgi:hypothetical protein
VFGEQVEKAEVRADPLPNSELPEHLQAVGTRTQQNAYQEAQRGACGVVLASILGVKEGRAGCSRIVPGVAG